MTSSHPLGEPLGVEDPPRIFLCRLQRLAPPRVVGDVSQLVGDEPLQALRGLPAEFGDVLQSEQDRGLPLVHHGPTRPAADPDVDDRRDFLFQPKHPPGPRCHFAL